MVVSVREKVYYKTLGKGKVELVFNTVQTQLEALYHFHKQSSVEEANNWLWNYLAHYNSLPYRYEKHSHFWRTGNKICLQKVIDKCVIGKNFAKWHENQTKEKYLPMLALL